MPAGVDPATVPNFPVEVSESDDAEAPPEAGVVLYVRNHSPREASIAVLAAGGVLSSGGLWAGNIGVGCYPMPMGSRLVLLDRSAVDRGASVINELYVQARDGARASIWLDIGEDGAVRSGSGTPDWQHGDAPC